ncbi:AAC(3) family N-acetyltransferase [Paenibacillus sediminis]|uniref:Aminoglycoside N(3)-acetyltransferase n=1 Tax=Paenibacillus sediminis TaxID=664909 RepID=A0ABS4H5T7_9BACL|nr:AAC(3) family N-acetyltransferase [Paenibacillus sediminis]MBP1937903.1 aminoglycoside 3-N-acetyltransferase [Paenibacillus sediminis]
MIIDKPITGQDLVEQFSKFGIHEGMTLLVHSSLKSIGGWIVGGAETVILALEQVLGAEGTLIMPTQSSQLTDPATWMYPPADPKWWDLIKDNMPPYDPQFTITVGMGIIPETFRKQKGVIRSRHPHVSFAAWGKDAEQMMAHHSLDCGLGEQSPLARIYDSDGWVLLLGVGHDSNTSFHLAEYRAQYEGKQEIVAGAPVKSGEGKEWVQFKDINFNSDDFDQIGTDFEKDCSGRYVRGHVEGASCLLAKQRDLVDYAVNWLEKYRRLEQTSASSSN